MGIFRRTTQTLIYTTLVLLLTACFKDNKTPVTPSIIPIPSEQIITKGVFLLNSDTKLSFDEELKEVSNLFKSYIEGGNKIKLNSTSKNTIHFKIDASITNIEGYHLKITPEEILISAKSQKGAFYAFQSLTQLLPIDTENANRSEIAIQCLEIKDAPQFKYRGMHLDVGRHFFSVDFIKKFINIMSMLKMNTFHWHLTEDQGWRIEIKKYPKLQEIAAFRNETLVGHYSEQPHKYDGEKYGGFYTQEQIKEVVKYASERQITIIPEIEMPGHAQAAISAYPALGCTGEQVEVATKWGVFDDIYCPTETTFKFLEDVIDEVITLFPGKYIHIGGDEAPKTRWKECNHCQKLIKKEGLKDEHELQSYFITRMEKYINSKGKQIIGWDEILEGGLAPNATVMSWRGTSGAVEAAKQKHNVILTPNTYCYFDHYQATNENEPLAIGGFLPLEKVYSFNPIPEELTKEESKYVLGAQGNIWTEYMQTSDKVEYMAFPRMVALSEVVWSSAENKNYEDFKKRLIYFQKTLDKLDVNYANHLYEISGNVTYKNDELLYTLEASSNDQNIRFTTDGTNPTLISKIYTQPILIEKNTVIKAASFNEKKIISHVFSQTIKSHKATGKKISLNVKPNEAYNAGGIKALINGVSGSDERYGDKEWLGFNGDDVEITIEFDNPTEINSIATRFYNGNGQWIYAPKDFNLQLKLEDGKTIISKSKIENRDSLLVNFNLDVSQFYPKGERIKSTSIKITIPNYGIIPKGKQGSSNKAWTFIDEIIIK
ncbi:beta-N-acetylhexosaminidase [Polaribacter sp. IC073]|uniref:beta-N-acetylhexosaminidase n=1 Tax=Polaribacter sp. IC073 TaxID=2508540 RepID=UPI0011BE20DC|nr:family 20 glycosylhydrolase [Polaribacter sp. IC073]TXD47238.1 family 20 glycosylhydrolase [Polaribacter sp. IC073]